MFLKRLRIRTGIAVLISVLIGWLVFVEPVRGLEQPSQRTVQLTLLPDYVTGQIEIVGMVSSPEEISLEEARLEDWGLGGDLHVWPADAAGTGHTYYLQGVLDNAVLVSSQEAGLDTITLGPFNLPPGNSILIAIPFSSLFVAGISPPPHNLEEVKRQNTPHVNLLYSAAEYPLDLFLEIPFTHITKEIELDLVPLVGELLQKRQDSFRLQGQVTFGDILAYPEFEKYCQWTVENPFWSYRMADTLFALDSLPVFHFGYLPPAFQYKPSYVLVRSELQSCSYENGVGVVITRITGRAFHNPDGASHYPEFLLEQDVPEQQLELQTRGVGTGIYQIQLGSIRMAPGDRLKVAIPGADIRRISPEPSRYSYSDEGQTLVEYVGPGKFALILEYTPRPVLFVQQLPATIRSLGSKAEALLASLSLGPWRWQPWGVFILCLAVLFVESRLGHWLARYQRVVVWLLAGLLCTYSFPNVFGLLLFASGAHLLAVWKTGSRGAILRGLTTILLVMVCLGMDTSARNLIFLLDGVHLELTLFTPSLLLLLVGLITLLYRKSAGSMRWTPDQLIAPAIFLFALSVLDALQKSLPAFLFAGALLFLMAPRFSSLMEKDAPEGPPALAGRVRAVGGSRLIWFGLLVLSIFIVSNDVTHTAEILAPNLGVARFLLEPVLLFLSVLLSFMASGALFLLLYSLLPFKEGYLKAIVFTVGLWLLFVLGVGGDDRLVTVLPAMLVGRFVYYLSTPLLIGIYLEIYFERQVGKATQVVKKTSGKASISGRTLSQILDPLKSVLGPVGSLLSLVAPALYAWAANQPLITSYFDVLQVLIQFTVS